ncbi:YtjB family periplasmic protein [Vibrio neptunius]|uniref:YtjB family periplasmic protein n=1 Tax=Vibrio neptunius TaxID=170651 RepID=A0ABS2ZXD2_9VIBR|nr:YtjB family periplasmic protein [Vibrio neptunius]MBN3491450.1 YtjB family periplasmic protein [Vibrio neptunius]MBN3513808.1 YtjB family periplasmic protein [Vibrio neptunius]MBN3548149.1 YtjB family periplasmic protein [Vibrio neptunius]MBN3572569.1 YtjB family periplasmic protein [Vibrio neptunius]MBN3576264.1 YtjB family periplasmic protein [Vibrio neptunius]
MEPSLFSFRIALRALAILSLIAMMGVIGINSVKITKGNEQIQKNQLETLIKVLVSQASLSAGDMIANQDQERLLKLTNQLAKDNLVFDATIYDAEGIRLASSDKGKSVREVLGLDTPLETARIGKQQLVEPIMHDNTAIGFVRITFETGKVTAFSDHYYRKSDRYMYTMVGMSFIAGLLLAIVVRRKPKRNSENLLLKEMS